MKLDTHSTDKNSLFKGVMTAYLLLILHAILVVGIIIILIFFNALITNMIWIILGGLLLTAISVYIIYRRRKAIGKTLSDILNSDAIKGQNIEIEILKGLASLKIGKNEVKNEPKLAPPSQQIEDPDSMKVRQLLELAKMLENGLISLEEYKELKKELV